MLDCGHPDDCEIQDEDGNCHCAWCDEVASLKQQIDGLRSVLEAKAVVVRGGEVEVVDGPIGYLAVYGGTVSCVSATPAAGS